MCLFCWFGIGVLFLFGFWLLFVFCWLFILLNWVLSWLLFFVVGDGVVVGNCGFKVLLFGSVFLEGLIIIFGVVWCWGVDVIWVWYWVLMVVWWSCVYLLLKFWKVIGGRFCFLCCFDFIWCNLLKFFFLSGLVIF